MTSDPAQDRPFVRTRSRVSTASAAGIWQRWTDVRFWPSDDLEVIAARHDGEMGRGTVVEITPRRGPRSRARVITFTPQTRFELAATLAGATMYVDHRLVTAPEGLSFTHTVSFTGPRAAFWGRMIGLRVAEGFPAVMLNIERAAG